MSERTAVTINFPVKPHVYKYLQNKVGEKLVVTKSDFFGSMVLDILSKNYSDLQAVKDDIPVEISLRYMEKMGVYIDSKIIRKFNTRVDDVLEKTHLWFKFYGEQKIPKETSLKQFCFNYI
jgi:capsid portal protein